MPAKPASAQRRNASGGEPAPPARSRASGKRSGRGGKIAPGRRRRRRRLSQGTASSARSGAGDPTRSSGVLPDRSPASAAIDRCAAADARPRTPPLEESPLHAGEDHQQRRVDAHRSRDELEVGTHIAPLSPLLWSVKRELLGQTTRPRPVHRCGWEPACPARGAGSRPRARRGPAGHVRRAPR
jgi:hypothetical protein